MSRLRLAVFLAILFTSSRAASQLPSFPGPLAIYTRDDNSTFASIPPSSVNFTFAVPSDPHDHSFSDWIGVVCLRPDQMTANQCATEGFDFVRCPDGDVSGILVRVAAYLANLLLGIIIMYSPGEASEAVWTQLITVYSLLISGVIAISSQSLSRFHSGMTVFLVMSPLSATLVVYAILGFCGRSHRLDSVLSSSREHLRARVLVVGFWLLSLAILIFTSIANDTHFTATSPCDSLQDKGASSAVVYNLIFIPYMGVAIVIFLFVGSYILKDGTPTAIVVVSCAPFSLLVIAIVCAVIISRHSLAKEFKEQNDRSKFWVFWKFSQTRYPFLHFCGVFLVPMIYWVAVNEIRLTGTPDNIFSPSFGQVLAVFVVLQPLLQVLKMNPRMFSWFTNLTIIQSLTGHTHRSISFMSLQMEDQEMGSMNSRDKPDVRADLTASHID